MESARLPYFDLILDGFKRGDEAASTAFERYVHWGYWPDPARADGSIPDLTTAMDRLNAEVLSALAPEDGQRIADVGCGFGGTLRSLAQAFPSARLTGVNVDRRQLLVAAGRTKAPSWIEADACRLPLASGSHDRVVAVECIFHFPSRQTFLKEAARVLKPGGILALSDFVPLRPGGASAWAGRWLEYQVGRGYGELGAGFEGDYRAMAAEAGLEQTVDRDVTRETLPTYPALMKLIEGPGTKALKRATVILEWLSRLRLLRYRIAAFRKQGPPGSRP